MKFHQKYLRFSLVILGFIIFILSGCKKSEDDSNDGGIVPMYGVKENSYKQNDSLRNPKNSESVKSDSLFQK